jgi:Domain of unknown function (DUF4432)
MPETKYRGRRAVSIENELLRVTVLAEGGHIAEIADKASGANPLWSPPWPSIEPSAFDGTKHTEYGTDSEAKLLAGIMGHNLCMDFFGGPSPEEAAAGMTVHGEASVASYEISASPLELTMRARFPAAQLAFARQVRLRPGSRVVAIVETVENLTAADRPIGWTQHVTLGPPFLERGATQFRASATRSKVFETDFGVTAYMKTGTVFDWPHVPRKDGGVSDLRVYTDAPVSSAFSTHLMDPHQGTAFFVAFSPKLGLALAYIWKREDFPWLGIWEENHSRTNPPWNGKTMTRGMEFGASPMPESRRQMIERGSLFGVPAFRWIPAKGSVRAEYWALLEPAAKVPETVAWPG